MKSKKILTIMAIISMMIILTILMFIAKLLNHQFDKYDNMSIDQVIEERGGSEYPYIQSENYYIILYGRNKEEVFYIDEENRNILINAYMKIIDRNILLDFVDSNYRIFEMVINNEEDYIFSIKYTGDRKDVTIYDVVGEWDSIEVEDDLYFFKTIKNMKSEYAAYIDYGDGHIDEINGEYILNKFE